MDAVEAGAEMQGKRGGEVVPGYGFEEWREGFREKCWVECESNPVRRHRDCYRCDDTTRAICFRALKRTLLCIEIAKTHRLRSVFLTRRSSLQRILLLVPLPLPLNLC